MIIKPHLSGIIVGSPQENILAHPLVNVVLNDLTLKNKYKLYSVDLDPVDGTSRSCMTPASGLLLGCIKVEAVTTLRIIRQEKLVQGNSEAL